MKNNIKVNINTIATLLTLFSFVVGGTLYFQKVLNKIEDNTILIENGIKNDIEQEQKVIYGHAEDAIRIFWIFIEDDDTLKLEIEKKENSKYKDDLMDACKNKVLKPLLILDYGETYIIKLCNIIRWEE